MDKLTIALIIFGVAFLVAWIVVMILYFTKKGKGPYLSPGGQTISGGGYIINSPILISIPPITSEDMKLFRDYFLSVYPVLNNISSGQITTLVQGSMFWYVIINNKSKMDLIQKYLGPYYSFEDMEKTNYEPPDLNILYSAPYTNPNIQRNVYDPYAWWNVEFYNGYPDNTYLECIHGDDTNSQYDVYGFWVYVAPGTGIYLDIGRSLRSHNKIHGNYLLHYHQDNKNGLYNFLKFILDASCIGTGWLKDEHGYYTGEFDKDPVDKNCPVDGKDWTEPKFIFQVNNNINIYTDAWACMTFGGPIPNIFYRPGETKPAYNGFATTKQRNFATTLINKTLGEDYVKNTLSQLKVVWPIPEQNTVHGNNGITAAIVYLVLSAICSPDPAVNVETGYRFPQDSGSVYFGQNTPSMRQFWYWTNSLSNTANFDRLMCIMGAELGYDSIQYTAEPNGNGCLAFEMVYIGKDVQWDDPKYPIKKKEQNWKGWAGINKATRIFNPFDPSQNQSCDWKQPEKMASGFCDSNVNKTVCSFICTPQVNKGISGIWPTSEPKSSNVSVQSGVPSQMVPTV